MKPSLASRAYGRGGLLENCSDPEQPPDTSPAKRACDAPGRSGSAGSRLYVVRIQCLPSGGLGQIHPSTSTRPAVCKRSGELGARKACPSGATPSDPGLTGSAYMRFIHSEDNVPCQPAIGQYLDQPATGRSASIRGQSVLRRRHPRPSDRLIMAGGDGSHPPTAPRAAACPPCSGSGNRQLLTPESAALASARSMALSLQPCAAIRRRFRSDLPSEPTSARSIPLPGPMVQQDLARA